MQYHTSRWRFLYLYFLAFALVATAIFFSILLLAIPSLLLLLIAEFAIHVHRLKIHDRYLVHQHGIFSKKKVTVHYSSISDITVHQSLLQRLIGIGELHINTPGSEAKEVILKGFPNVNRIHDLVIRNIHR